MQASKHAHNCKNKITKKEKNFFQQRAKKLL